MKYVDDNKLYMNSPAIDGGYGSGKNRHGFGHSKWMKGAELNDDIIDADNYSFEILVLSGQRGSWRVNK